jgi:hypothetical protein
MTRKNRQKHRQFDRQFAALPSGFPASRRAGLVLKNATPQ